MGGIESSSTLSMEVVTCSPIAQALPGEQRMVRFPQLRNKYSVSQFEPHTQPPPLNLSIHKCFSCSKRSAWKLSEKHNPPWAGGLPWRTSAHTMIAFITWEEEPCLCYRPGAPLNKFRASGTWEGWNIPQTHGEPLAREAECNWTLRGKAGVWVGLVCKGALSTCSSRGWGGRGQRTSTLRYLCLYFPSVSKMCKCTLWDAREEQRTKEKYSKS